MASLGDYNHNRLGVERVPVMYWRSSKLSGRIWWMLVNETELAELQPSEVLRLVLPDCRVKPLKLQANETN